VFKPKRKNHYNGKVYVLINGLTFSASTLFCNTIKGQENVILAGEETGGGWYGNSGILIPKIVLPNTKLRIRLPFFRLVQYQHIPIKGTGVAPDIYIGPDWRDVINDVDTKLERVRQMISNK
jgi:C-terminal processing protease CtpA/Prc